MQLQGGGGRQRGALTTDDNAADVRATPRDAGMIQTTGPRSRLRLRPRRRRFRYGIPRPAAPRPTAHGPVGRGVAARRSAVEPESGLNRRRAERAPSSRPPARPDRPSSPRAGRLWCGPRRRVAPVPGWRTPTTPPQYGGGGGACVTTPTRTARAIGPAMSSAL
ncbi:hypothetical protein C1N79_29495 [Streptomyces sp. SGAir0924]|nr:hypothetical protein C1N79_29495 [Streptomyces sp. SGAir0924]